MDWLEVDASAAPGGRDLDVDVEQLQAEGQRLHAEDQRLHAERARGIVDQVAHQQFAAAVRRHQRQLRRFCVSRLGL